MLDYFIDRRYRVLSVLLVLFLISFWGVFKLSIDPNNRVFFSPHHAKFAELLDLESTFGSNTELVYVLSSPHGLLGSAELRSSVDWMTDRAWSIDGVSSVDSIATFPHVSVNADDLVIQGTLEYACGHAECEASKVGALTPEYLVNRFVSRDLNSVAVVARVDLSEHSDRDVLMVASQATRLKDAFRSEFPDLEIFMTGGVPMMEAFFTAAASDSAVLMPIALLVIFAVLGYFLGSYLQAFLLALLGVVSVIITMGIAGWFGHVLNTATATAPLIIFTLVVASSMHLFMHVSGSQSEADVQSVSKRVRGAARSNLVPIVLTTLTTAFGFASMISVSAPPLRELGALAALGVIIGSTLSLIVIPGIFVILPSATIASSAMNLQMPMNRYARWLEKTRPNALVACVLVILSILGVSRLQFDEDFVRYFSEDTMFRSDTEHISKVLAGPYHIDFVYDSGEIGGIFSSSAVLEVAAIASYLKADDRVVNVFSVVDILRTISSVFAPGEDLAQADAAQLAQYFLTYELSLDRGQSTLDFVDTDRRFARTSVLLRDVSMGEIRSLVESSEAWIHRNFPNAKVTVTGEGVPTAYLSGESISEMSWGIALSMLASAALVALWLRKAAVALVVFAATVVPLLAGFGIWGWLGGDIGMAGTLVIATTIGVVVDDTIHLAYRYLDGKRRHDLTPWGAAAYSLHKTGPALVATSVSLAVGFSVLVFSDFQMNSTFGICTSLVVTLALAFNLTVTPRLLKAIA